MEKNKLQEAQEELSYYFNDIEVDTIDNTIVIRDYESCGKYPAVFMYVVDEDRAYSEDLSFPRGDDADNIKGPVEFARWVESFYD